MSSRNEALETIKQLIPTLNVADLSRVASGMAFRAGARAGLAFTAYHAGFGWGAWAMTLAAVALSLGVVVSLLRWLDERKGYAT